MHILDNSIIPTLPVLHLFCEDLLCADIIKKSYAHPSETLLARREHPAHRPIHLTHQLKYVSIGWAQS